MVLRLALVCVAAVLFAMGALAAETAPPRYTKTVGMPNVRLPTESRLVPTESPIVRPFSYELLPIWSGGKNVFAALPNYEPGTARTVNLVAPVSSQKRSKASMPPNPFAKLRKLCLALPEAHEVEAWGEPTFRVRNKMFAMAAHANTHHGAGRHAVWVKSTSDEQQQRIAAAPDRFFKPPYVGPSGWVGTWLDGDVARDDLAELLADAYRMIAPKRLIDQM